MCVGAAGPPQYHSHSELSRTQEERCWPILSRQFQLPRPAVQLKIPSADFQSSCYQENTENEKKKPKVEVSFLAITSKLTEENDPAVPNSFWIIPQVPASGTPEGVILIEWVTWYGDLGKSDLVGSFSLFVHCGKFARFKHTNLLSVVFVSL